MLTLGYCLQSGLICSGEKAFLHAPSQVPPRTTAALSPVPSSDSTTSAAVLWNPESDLVSP